MRDLGPAPWWRRCDGTDVHSLQQAITDAAQALGTFDVLLNNVGSDDRHALEDVTPAYWDQRIGINQRAAFFAIQAVVPGMRGQGRGSIINLGSTGWQTRSAGYPCYATAKSSMNGMMRGMAKSLGEQRIRINVLSPGWVMTGRQLTQWLDAESEKEWMKSQCLPDRSCPQTSRQWPSSSPPTHRKRARRKSSWSTRAGLDLDSAGLVSQGVAARILRWLLP